MSTVPDPSQNTLPNVRFFSVAEAALIFGVGREQIYTWIKAEELRVYRFGPSNHDIRISRRDLEILIDTQIADEGEDDIEDKEGEEPCA